MSLIRSGDYSVSRQVAAESVLMKEEAHSLANLHDIVVPDAPPLWPPAPGMWLFGAVVLSCVLVLVALVYLHRQRSAYRRAGLLLLETAESNYEVSVALKRVALAAFPREEVAPLHGQVWGMFLKQTCPAENFEHLVGADESASATPQLKQSAATWIRHHQAKGGG